MLDVLLNPIVLKALVAACLASVLSAVIGSFTVLKKLSTMGAAIAHACLAGALLAYLVKLNPSLGALALSLAFALVTAYTSEKHAEKADTILGVSFGFSTALAALALSLAREYTVTAFTYLVGDVLGVSLEDLILLAVFTYASIILVVFFYKEFKFITFDPEAAEAMGLNVKLYNYLLVVLIAITAVVELLVVGSILSVVLLVAPAAASQELVHSLRKMIVLSVTIAVFSSVAGVMMSVLAHAPTSPTIGILASLIYLASLIISPKRRKIKRHYYRRRRKKR